jgi:hypothetical protein
LSLLDSLLRERRIRAALRRLFDPANQDGQAIVAWLADFCHARRSSVMVSAQTGNVDPLATAVAEGRREVFLAIVQRAGLDDRQLDAAIQREVTYGGSGFDPGG